MGRAAGSKPATKAQEGLPRPPKSSFSASVQLQPATKAQEGCLVRPPKSSFSGLHVSHASVQLHDDDDVNVDVDVEKMAQKM